MFNRKMGKILNEYYENLLNQIIIIDGLIEAVDKIEPKTILVYGFVTESNFDEIFGYAKSKGVNIIIPHSKIDKYKKEDAIYGTR